MDRARTPTPLHAEPGGMITDFPKKKRTSNQEGGPRVLRSGLLIIYLLPNVAGSAADRSTFFLLNGVVGDGPRVHSISTSRRAGRDDYRFFKKKADFESRRRPSGAEGRASGHSPPSGCGWLRRGYFIFLFAQRRSRRWTARALHLHFTQSRAG